MKNRTAFTLIELMVSVALAGILALVLGTMIRSAAEIFIETGTISTINDNVSKALYGSGSRHGLLWDIRISTGIYTSLPDSIVISHPGGEDISYYLSGETLKRKTLSTPPVEISLAKNITALTFTYYDILPTGLLASTTVPFNADYVELSIKAAKKERSMESFASARIRNKS